MSVRFGPSLSASQPQKKPPAMAKVIAAIRIRLACAWPSASVSPVLTAMLTVYSTIIAITVLIASV